MPAAKYLFTFLIEVVTKYIVGRSKSKKGGNRKTGRVTQLKHVLTTRIAISSDSK